MRTAAGLWWAALPFEAVADGEQLPLTFPCHFLALLQEVSSVSHYRPFYWLNICIHSPCLWFSLVAALRALPVSLGAGAGGPRCSAPRPARSAVIPVQMCRLPSRLKQPEYYAQPSSSLEKTIRALAEEKEGKCSSESASPSRKSSRMGKSAGLPFLPLAGCHPQSSPAGGRRLIQLCSAGRDSQDAVGGGPYILSLLLLMRPPSCESVRTSVCHPGP
ncbi:unnamed protein product [Rangifer tarandus platyrhynchus]|uniref:Uncharacterized protein n=1 Tax=Rangifer tarandus platyrhynchus TaxID=3082113 RepID=A0ABN8Z5B7_RANTA|nr:unnamed protein product [Rangifer tarandus platyrhynchus]